MCDWYIVVCLYSCYHSCVQFSAFGLHLACCLLSAEPVSCGWEGFSQGVSARRPGVDVDSHVSYLKSESRYSGAGSLPQSSTGTWYGCAQICSGVTATAQSTFNNYWCICIYLHFKIEFMLHCVVKLKVQCSAVQCSTVQCSTVQYSAVQYSAVQYSAVQYSTVQYSTVQYSTVQCSTVQYSAVQYSTVQYSTVQCSTVQYSTVQCSAV